jgi:hypothetical protein
MNSMLNWELINFDGRDLIRCNIQCMCCCPIEAVGFLYSSQRKSLIIIADDLGIPDETFKHIVNAADGRVKTSEVKEMLEVLGL